MKTKEYMTESGFFSQNKGTGQPFLYNYKDFLKLYEKRLWKLPEDRRDLLEKDIVNAWKRLGATTEEVRDISYSVESSNLRKLKDFILNFIKEDFNNRCNLLSNSVGFEAFFREDGKVVVHPIGFLVA